MSIYKVDQNHMNHIAPLFAGHTDTLILSCLQGCMGEAWADDVEHPASAQIVLADFCFFGGVPNAELAGNRPPERKSDFVIMIPPTEEWAEVIEQVYGEKTKRVERYAIKKEPGIFDKEKLASFVAQLDPEYEVKLFDEEIFRQTKEQKWARDFTSQFSEYADFAKRGLGAAVCRQGELIAGASSYTVYREGIEIEIVTREDYRRQGLATVCGAKLILACLERGWYPSWDAQNQWSASLAQKLGYHFDKAYPAYEVFAFGDRINR